MIKCKWVIVSILWLCVASCQANEIKNITQDVIEEKLESVLSTSFDDFQITKIYSKNDNSHDYIKSSLGLKFIGTALNVNKQEYYFKSLVSKNSSHIGVAIVEYANNIDAKQALNAIESLNGYFEKTKILTKYTIRNEGNLNIVFYTESAADSLVNDILTKLANPNP